MTTESHIASLRRKHRQIDEQIIDAHMNHMPVNDLKRKKLKIKDEILHLSQFIRESEAA